MSFALVYAFWGGKPHCFADAAAVSFEVVEIAVILYFDARGSWISGIAWAWVVQGTSAMEPSVEPLRPIMPRRIGMAEVI